MDTAHVRRWRLIREGTKHEPVKYRNLNAIASAAKAVMPLVDCPSCGLRSEPTFRFVLDENQIEYVSKALKDIPAGTDADRTWGVKQVIDFQEQFVSMFGGRAPAPGQQYLDFETVKLPESNDIFVIQRHVFVRKTSIIEELLCKSGVELRPQGQSPWLQAIPEFAADQPVVTDGWLYDCRKEDYFAFLRRAGKNMLKAYDLPIDYGIDPTCEYCYICYHNAWPPPSSSPQPVGPLLISRHVLYPIWQFEDDQDELLVHLRTQQTVALVELELPPWPCIDH